MKLRLSSRLALRNSWPALPWLVGGLFGIAYLPMVGQGELAAFVGAAGLALGTLFVTQGFGRAGDQLSRLELQGMVATTVAEDMVSNGRRLEPLLTALRRRPGEVPQLVVVGPLWLRGAELVRRHMMELDWQREFLAHMLALYHNLEETEGLRHLYAQSLAVGGPPDFAVMMAEQLRNLSRGLLQEMKEVEETLHGLKFYHPGSLGERMRRKME